MSVVDGRPRDGEVGAAAARLPARRRGRGSGRCRRWSRPATGWSRPTSGATRPGPARSDAVGLRRPSSWSPTCSAWPTRSGIDRFHLVGHDWGGAVAWQVAGRHADRLRTLTRAVDAASGGVRRWRCRASGGSDQAESMGTWTSSAPRAARTCMLADEAGLLKLRLPRCSGLSEEEAAPYARGHSATPERCEPRSTGTGPPDITLVDGLGRSSSPTLYIWSTDDVALRTGGGARPRPIRRRAVSVRGARRRRPLGPGAHRRMRSTRPARAPRRVAERPCDRPTSADVAAGVQAVIGDRRAGRHLIGQHLVDLVGHAHATVRRLGPDQVRACWCRGTPSAASRRRSVQRLGVAVGGQDPRAVGAAGARRSSR